MSYLDYKFEDSIAFVNTFDELPLWSASFGLLLLKHIDLKPNITAVDIGCGAGFPLLELAERLGHTSKLYGIDPWANAIQRTKQKIKDYSISNVELIESSAEKISLDNDSIDLIVSNLGINNFSDPDVVFKECMRILKPGGKLALTTNVYGHWKEFYGIFYETLSQLKKEHLIAVLKKDEEHRANIKSTEKLFTDNGFKIDKQFTENFDMRFANGNAFLNHHFIKLGWLTGWLEIFPKEEHKEIFTALEKNLNSNAERSGGLSFTVPMLFMQGKK